MRSHLLVPLLVAGLASSTLAQQRKSLGFGPVHPHAVFDTTPRSQLSDFRAESLASSPENVARIFIEEQTGFDVNSYYIREDSYTDKNTGITHIYARQLVDGVEVVDGDININVRDGVVISYGNSFFRGELEPSSILGPSSVDPHGEYCEQLSEQLAAQEEQHLLATSGQVVIQESDRKTISSLRRIHAHNCSPVSTLGSEQQGTLAFDPRKPLLQFMLKATPKSSVVEHIESQYDSLVDSLDSTFEHSSIQGRQAMVELISNVPDTVSPVKARFAYAQVPVGDHVELHPIWKFEVEMADNWYEASVSAHAPHRIISVVDWASDAPIPDEPVEKKPATYNVFKWGINDPSEGERSIEHENFDTLASPVGWHSLPYRKDPSHGYVKFKDGEFWHNTTTTWGNNVFAHEDWEGANNWIDNYRPDAGESLAFDFKYNPKNTDRGEALAEARKYINATVTQLFYTSNMVHDLYYRYGFDEVSGNFQQYNFGRGGRDGDAVIANAQDGSGYNNANFMTPPDGQNGRCRMYLWNTASPYRDGDLEAGIVIHELSHGLSTRLTGGPANSGCLGWGESGGMGEGWGDFLATMIRSTSEYSDFPMGAWAANRDNGIRNYPYSLDFEINPSTYETLDKPGYWGVHAIGEVWAEILWTVAQGLIEKHGYSDTLFPPKPLENGTVPEGEFYRPREYTAAGEEKPLVPIHGNSLIVQLVINGMKLQPCRPSFFEARDAIIQADQILTGGENACELWAGFSQRGLGPDARVDGRTPWGGGIRSNDYEVPTACKKEKIPEDPEFA